MNLQAEKLNKARISDELRCKVKSVNYEVVASWRHCEESYTEGLAIYNGFLFESTGGDKNSPPPSTLQQFKLRSHSALMRVDVNEDYFAEGLTIFEGKIFQLTETSHLGLIYDLNDLTKPPRCFDYNGWNIGWGITNDGNQLIISDTSDHLHFVDPHSFKVTRSIPLHYQDGTSLNSLNEMEFVNGLIYANIYPLDLAARICPRDGTVIDLIDLHELRPRKPEAGDTNGIAYDDVSGNWFVTGKMWPTLYEIRLLEEFSAKGAAKP